MGGGMILLDTPEAVVVHGPWQETLEIAKERGGVDALVVDAPYSTVTHSGHDKGAVDANRGADMARRIAARDGVGRGHRRALKPRRTIAGYGTSERREIDYAAWSPADVAGCVAAWSPAVRGWCVSITDHVLAPAWAEAFTAAGRYPFAPLPLFSPGSRVRLSGDGPSSWTCQIVAARPTTREFFEWGTLPGGYVVAPERMWAVGGKPLAAMLAIVADYSRRGDLVADFCAGGGTTARAARILGRRFIGGDIDEKAARETARVVAAAREQLPLALGGT